MPTPISYLQIKNVQAALVWKSKTGANIGGVSPSSFGMEQGVVLGLPLASLLYIQNSATNPGYADWLAGGVFPLPESCTGHLQMGVLFCVDADSLAHAQAVEVDTKITDANKVTYDGSLQFDYGQSAALMYVQIDRNSKWVNTGIILPKFAPGVVHSILVEYEFNTVLKTSSVVSITIDGVLYPIQQTMWNIPGSSMGWAANEILPQLQMDVKPIAGAAWKWVIIDMFYNVW
jgi:hypothetical protein